MENGGFAMLQITIREPWSAFTHFIGMMLSIIAAVPLLIKAGLSGTGMIFWSCAIFISSMILLYGASTLYHSISIGGRLERICKKMDHMMIFVLIAGSYTPVCVIALGENLGYPLLALVWGVAIVGMIIKGFWVYCPKWFSSILYIAMGWLCVLVFRPLMETLPAAAFGWLFAGGVIYTVGGIIYALKLPLFNQLHKNFGSHEIFHLFVLAGSICHFIFVFRYLA